MGDEAGGRGGPRAVGWRGAWLCALLLALGCGYPNHPHDVRVLDPVPPQGPLFSAALEQTTGVAMKPGNQVELVENGAIFGALEDDVRAAERSLHLSVFIWRKCEASDRITRAVAERARAGVSCRIIVDPLWSRGFQEEVHADLASAGCDVRYYRPLNRHRTPEGWATRNHRRTVVIDNRVGYTGGFGLWRSWVGEGLTQDEWRDTAVRVRGPAVKDLQLAFAENWQEVGGPLLPPESIAEQEDAGPMPAAFVGSSSTRTVSDAERTTALVIASAQRRLWIANSYFVPSTAVADMLVDRAKRGVDVRVLAPGPVHDVPPVRAAQRSTYDRLLSAGVRIYEYQPSMMHAKSFLVDDSLVVVGSTNLDPLSFKKMEEGSLLVEDEGLARQLEQNLLEDFRRSQEIRWEVWSKRSIFARLAQQLSAIFGGYL